MRDAGRPGAACFTRSWRASARTGSTPATASTDPARGRSRGTARYPPGRSRSAADGRGGTDADLAALVDRLGARLGCNPRPAPARRQPASAGRRRAAPFRPCATCRRIDDMLEERIAQPSASAVRAARADRRDGNGAGRAAGAVSAGGAPCTRSPPSKGPERIAAPWWTDSGSRPRLFPGRGRPGPPLLAVPRGPLRLGDAAPRWFLHGLFG